MLTNCLFPVTVFFGSFPVVNTPTATPTGVRVKKQLNHMQGSHFTFIPCLAGGSMEHLHFLDKLLYNQIGDGGSNIVDVTQSDMCSK